MEESAPNKHPWATPEVVSAIGEAVDALMEGRAGLHDIPLDVQCLVYLGEISGRRSMEQKWRAAEDRADSLYLSKYGEPFQAPKRSWSDVLRARGKHEEAAKVEADLQAMLLDGGDLR